MELNRLIVTLLILDDVLRDIISSLLQIKSLVYKNRDELDNKKRIELFKCLKRFCYNFPVSVHLLHALSNWYGMHLPFKLKYKFDKKNLAYGYEMNVSCFFFILRNVLRLRI